MMFPLPVRLCRPDDGQRGEGHVVSDLRRGEAAGLYRRHWRHLLAGADDLQCVALPAPQEEKWPQQHIHRHPQGCVCSSSVCVCVFQRAVCYKCKPLSPKNCYKYFGTTVLKCIFLTTFYFYFLHFEPKYLYFLLLTFSKLAGYFSLNLVAWSLLFRVIDLNTIRVSIISWSSLKKRDQWKRCHVAVVQHGNIH